MRSKIDVKYFTSMDADVNRVRLIESGSGIPRVADTLRVSTRAVRLSPLAV
jgi:hypothetical protein